MLPRVFIYTLKQVTDLTYKDNKSIFVHLNKFQGCFDQLSSMGMKFEEVLVLWLLNTLLKLWECFRVSLTNATPKGSVTMEYVRSGFLNEEM